MRLIDRLLFNSRSRVFQEIFVLTGYNKKRGLDQVTHRLLLLTILYEESTYWEPVLTRFPTDTEEKKVI